MHSHQKNGKYFWNFVLKNEAKSAISQNPHFIKQTQKLHGRQLVNKRGFRTFLSSRPHQDGVGVPPSSLVCHKLFIVIYIYFCNLLLPRFCGSLFLHIFLFLLLSLLDYFIIKFHWTQTQSKTKNGKFVNLILNRWLNLCHVWNFNLLALSAPIYAEYRNLKFSFSISVISVVDPC